VPESFWPELMASPITVDDRTDEIARLDGDHPTMVMPHSTWHRVEVIEPGRVIFMMYGRCPQHRPLQARGRPTTIRTADATSIAAVVSANAVP